MLFDTKFYNLSCFFRWLFLPLSMYVCMYVYMYIKVPVEAIKAYRGAALLIPDLEIRWR